LKKALEKARLSHGEVHTAGTPRRLAIWIDGLVSGQEDLEKEVVGPPARIAFDADGQPTRAALGFAKKQGIDPASLYKKATPKGDYLAGVVKNVGQKTEVLLRDILAELVDTLPFRKSMRWGHESVSFARPVHWICALYGGEVIPFTFGDVATGSKTYGHRFMAPQAIEVESAQSWSSSLAAAHVVVDIEAREAIIRDALREFSSQTDGSVVEDESLIREVAGLVEDPWGQLGHFHVDNLKLPREVLISAMRKHQRYFAFEDSEGRLLPCFAVFNNTRVKDPDVVAHGHERVLQARLYDARFFYSEDQALSLEGRLEKLSRVRFLGGLKKIEVGEDLLARTDRIEEITAIVAGRAYSGDAQVMADAKRAARLSKADLTTLMVGEFPDLQGTIGAYYARANGERDAVAEAIGEQYLPKGSGGRPASSAAGVCLALADKLELMAACFAVGLVPSGNKDPYGLRRAALGILRTLEEADLDLDLREVVTASVEVVKGSGEGATVEEIMAFFRGRLRGELIEAYRTDIVEAVLDAGFDRTLDARRRAEALDAIATEADLGPLGEAFKRINNILQKNAGAVEDGAAFDEAGVVEDEERVLGALALEIAEAMREELGLGDYRAALGNLLRLEKPLDAFFSKVMVMHEDPALRKNRLALLMHLRRTFSTVANVSRIQVRAAQ
jgi:glycyl-tRNA synthetase beta chain